MYKRAIRIRFRSDDEFAPFHIARGFAARAVPHIARRFGESLGECGYLRRKAVHEESDRRIGSGSGFRAMPKRRIAISAEEEGSKATTQRLRDKVLFGERSIANAGDAPAAGPRDANVQPPCLSSLTAGITGRAGLVSLMGSFLFGDPPIPASLLAIFLERS